MLQPQNDVKSKACQHLEIFERNFMDNRVPEFTRALRRFDKKCRMFFSKH